MNELQAKPTSALSRFPLPALFAVLFVILAVINGVIALLTKEGSDIAVAAAGVIVGQFGLPIVWAVFGQMRF